MKTSHRILINDSRDLTLLGDNSVDLVVTSPPYPMIGMWDELFSGFSSGIEKALNSEKGLMAFELMHLELDKVWRELFRIVKPGSFVCINIGDATRTIGGRFRLYSNHSRIVTACTNMGFDSLPLILWRKQTNAPNKFMGSGMLPGGAYVTLEHEYILILRKGGKREFKSSEAKALRMESSFFWEERNRWFSDLWEFKGTVQKLKKLDPRDRSAAYPYELAERLINMYSLFGDTVLDPFLGTGTTSRAAAALGRNSLGVEIDNGFSSHIFSDTGRIIALSEERLSERIDDHISFIYEYTERKGPPKHINTNHGFPVITRQETEIRLRKLKRLKHEDAFSVCAEYEPLGRLWSDSSLNSTRPVSLGLKKESDRMKESQPELFY